MGDNCLQRFEFAAFLMLASNLIPKLCISRFTCIFVAGRPNHIVMQCFPFKANSRIYSLDTMHPICWCIFYPMQQVPLQLYGCTAFFSTKNSSKIDLSVMHELLQQIPAVEMLPLCEYTVHKSFARLTTANTVIISSQETGGKPAVENAAWSVAAEFSSWVCVLHGSTRLPISIQSCSWITQTEQLLDQRINCSFKMTISLEA